MEFRPQELETLLQGRVNPPLDWVDAAVREINAIEAANQIEYEETVGGDTVSWISSEQMREIIRKHEPKT